MSTQLIFINSRLDKHHYSETGIFLHLVSTAVYQTTSIKVFIISDETLYDVLQYDLSYFVEQHCYDDVELQ